MRIAAFTRLSLGLIASILCSQVAAASCEAPYAVDALLGDLIDVEAGLRDGDDESVTTSVRKLEQGLSCLGEIIPPQIVGRAYRAVGAGLVVLGDADRGEGWLRTAAEIEQSFDYGLEDLPVDHPVREVYATARMAFGDPEEMEGVQFVPEGKHFLDGREVDSPRARVGRPHLYQHDTGTVQSWIIQGNTFPSSAVVIAVAEADDAASKRKRGRRGRAAAEVDAGDTGDSAVERALSSSSTVVLARQRPPEKTPLMIAGGAVMLGAGGVYALAMQRKAAFENAETKEDVEKFAQQANQLTLVSAAVLAVGTGTLTWGIILDGGGQPLPSLNLRF